ncbi:MAG: FtsX-like permease family protein [Chloroflexi bacterium]|nr:FtsX-like permease family protein [Chloroflexota bacterium]MCL5275173.1 FtsX-like permease family protein [Chloroflexota bacterium]
MRPIRTFLAIFIVAARRLWSTRGLALASALGFIAAIALAFSVPMYADAVYHRILTRELGITDPGSSALPPFSFIFKLRTFFQESAQWSDIAPVDRFMDQQVPSLVGLPRKELLRYYQTANLRLFSLTDPSAFAQRKPLLLIPLVAIGDLGNHINLIQGKLPADTPTADGYTGVLVSKLVSDRLGVQVGDKYVAFTGREDRGAIRVPVVVSGVWEPRDRNDSYWFYRPDLLDIMLLTTDTAFTHNIAPTLGQNMNEAIWFMDFNGDSLRVWNVPDFLARIDGLLAAEKAQNINVDMSASPQDGLLRYQRDSRALMLQLYAFSVPLFLLVFAFVILVAGLTVNSQRNEIAVLRSRGATAWQVMGIASMQSIVLALFSLGLGALAALGIAALIGQARSFLVFASGDLLPVAVSRSSLPFGLIAAGVTIVITVIPVIDAARHTIITYRLERARALKTPSWQRMWLDVLLLIPTVYWTYMLQKQGVIDVPLLGTSSGNPLSSPALFLVPSLMMFAMTLFLIRLLPFLLRALAWLLGKLPGISLVLAMRQLARSPGLYTTPMLLLVLTLSLATFTTTIATTLDQYTEQRARYTVGGDVKLTSTGQSSQPPPAQAPGSFGQAGSMSSDSGGDLTAALQQAQAEDAGPRWLFVPISDYLNAKDVQAATRVGRYPAIAHFSVGGDTSGHVIGIDRSDFANIAFWRSDFAAQPFGSLMNALAMTPDGVLVSENALSDHVMRIGDALQAKVQFPSVDVDMTFRVVGSFKLWPAWFPNVKDDGTLIVANLDYLFENSGGQSPYDVWIKVKPGHDPAAVIPEARLIDKSAWSGTDVNSMIAGEQTKPERQGLFGMLSIGFLAAALFTVLGFFLYAVFSFRRRFIELGMLRAIGLSATQMALSLAWEIALLLGLGMLCGTGLGLFVSRLYIPFLQESASDPTHALPFVVLTNWDAIYDVYILFGALFLVAVPALVLFLRRIKIFQAVKLGEAE